MFRKMMMMNDSIEQEQPVIKSYSRRKPQATVKTQLQTPSQSPNVQGVNAVNAIYNLCEVGADSSLCLLNFSAQPGEKKRLLSITGASTFLVNYAQDQYPSKIEIKVNQVGGYLDKAGVATHTVGVLVPDGPAVPVYNGGGVIGYNVAYKLLQNSSPVDISNMPQLTFNVATGIGSTPAVYPLAEPITFTLQITRVIF